MVETVVKLGGGLLAHPAFFDAAIRSIGATASGRRLLVIPGGGPFADAVRQADHRLGLSDNAAHWMAVLAMDQSAHLVADRLPGGVVVTAWSEIAGVLESGRIPVFAPSRELRTADPLPHSWEVTSDSIAAWVAGQVGARRLVLIKPPGVGFHSSDGSSGTADPAALGGIVDPYFPQALPEQVAWSIVPADQLERLR